MTLFEYHIVYPEGETREISHQLNTSDIVDINGYPLATPLPTHKMIAYHVCKKRTAENRGLEVTWYFLEQLTATELAEFT